MPTQNSTEIFFSALEIGKLQPLLVIFPSLPEPQGEKFDSLPDAWKIWGETKGKSCIFGDYVSFCGQKSEESSKVEEIS